MTSAKSNAAIFGLLIISIVTTLFLFFIDEGYYNFRWMADKGNWVVFVIYVVLLLLPQLFLVGLYQWLLSPFIQRSWIHSSLQILLIVSGIASGITLAFMLFS